MTLRDKFIQDSPLTGRRRLGPLAWIALFIAFLFLGACLLGYVRLVTRNVTKIEEPAVADAGATAAPFEESPTLAVALPGTTTITTSRPITWTVGRTQDPITGRAIYDGPAEIKQWAIRDYEAAQQWMLDHLFEKDYLLAHLGEYFSGDALEMERQSLTESFDQTHMIWAPLIAQPRQPAPLDRPIFETFSADGRQMTLSDYTEAGAWKQYNTQTRALISSKAHKFLWTYTVEYDGNRSRWKVARLRLIYDIDADRPSYTNEP